MESIRRERRRSRRYFLGESVFVAVRPDFSRVGTIVDVCRDGLAMEYVTDLPPLESGPIVVDIFSEHLPEMVRGVPCFVVYDRAASQGQVRGKGAIVSRRCGLRFGEIPAGASKVLEAFFRLHSRRPGADP